LLFRTFGDSLLSYECPEKQKKVLHSGLSFDGLQGCPRQRKGYVIPRSFAFKRMKTDKKAALRSNAFFACKDARGGGGICNPD
jgi:hypothetical protein